MMHTGIHIVSAENAAPGEPDAAITLPSTGLLAEGVVHDLNNLLGIIVGYSAELSAQPQVSPAARTIIAEMDKAVDAARVVAGGLLAVSRRPRLAPQPIDLHRTVQRTGSMLANSMGPSITWVERLGASVSSMEALPGQPEQILINLVLNARDAMPAGGTLVVETANAPFAGAGNYVRLSVSDTGCGMDAQTQARAFESFFTTKPRGQGIGLGLATVAAIVKNSGGHIAVESRPGQGTTFHVYFPCALLPAGVTAPAAPVCAPAVSATILLVEDSPSLRALTRRILERAGYVVFDAGDAAAALDLVQASRSSISLLITDIHLPGTGGLELARKVAALQPAAGVLFMSGHCDGREPVALTKPFTREQLLTAVAEQLQPSGCKPVSAHPRVYSLTRGPV